jgi:hypothetical protein
MFPSWPIRTHQTLPTVPFLLLWPFPLVFFSFFGIPI